MCVVCAREKEGRLKGLWLLFYELGLYVGFLWGRALLVVPEPASSIIPMLAHTGHPAPFNPVLVACHRFKRTQVDPPYLPEILISEYVLSWSACTNKPPEHGVELGPPEHCSEWLTPLCHRGRLASTQQLPVKAIWNKMVCYGHSRLSKLVPFKSPYAISYSSTVTICPFSIVSNNALSVKYLSFLHFHPPQSLGSFA